jgi:UDP-glucose:(heptosyl)LPS alpha-1,3-glucosyltransferase
MTCATADHVTIVAHDIGPIGGMEQQIARLVDGLLVRGRHVTVIARSCDVAPHEHLVTIPVRAPAGPFPAAYPWFAMAAGPIVARRRRGIVHTAGAIVPNAVDVATIHFCHHAFAALGAPSRASRDTPAHRANAAVSAAFCRTAERVVYRPGRVRAAVAVSDGVRREVERWFPRLRDGLHTIPHGVDLVRFRPDPRRRAHVRQQLGIDADALVAIFVGGDWARKGLSHAIAAIAAARRWRLLVVGRGDETAYAANARRAGAGDRVHFVGATCDTSAQFAAADAFVLPTRYETFSLVTYEAAAAGLPLLVTRVSGPDQLIEEGVNGAFLDGLPAGTAAWLTRLHDADLRAAMGAAARRACAPYTWDAAVDRHVELYDELAAARAAR